MAYTKRRGMGDYDRVANWNWMYYPPPYGFANPKRPTPKAPPEFYAPAATMGLGCGSCSGNCGGGCGRPPGLGDDSGTILGVPGAQLLQYVAIGIGAWFLYGAVKGAGRR